MRALVVYESMYGNTRTIANAVADGLASRVNVDVMEVGDAPTVVGDDVGLMVVGGPTHAFGMSRPETRRSAADGAVGPLQDRESERARQWGRQLAARVATVAGEADG